MEAPIEAVQDERPTGRFYKPGTSEPADFVLRWTRRGEKSPQYQVMDQFEYVDHLRRSHMAPVDLNNNRTDFASIPPFLTWLVPKDGAHTPAAILHDSFIGGKVGVDYLTSDGEQVTDRHADYLFREAMHGLGVGLVRRWMMWAAVSLRTLCIRIAKDNVVTADKTEKRWLRIVPIAAAVAVIAFFSCVMALDVPDIANSAEGFDNWGWSKDLLGWFNIFGRKPALEEIGLGVLLVLLASVALSAVVGLVTRSMQGVIAGAIAGALIGFLALPMVAAAVGWLGYQLLELIGRRFDSARKMTPDGGLPFAG